MKTEGLEEKKSGFIADPYFLALIGAGLFVRVVATLLTDDAAVLTADDKLYVERVEQWMQGEGFETGGFVRPPLYFALLAVVWQLCDALGIEWVLAAKLLQCVAGAATALPLYASAHALAGRRTARFAVAFLLFDPTLVAYAHLIWPETVYSLIVAIVFDGIRRLAPDRTTRALVLGALCGAAMLLKPAFGLFTLVLAASWLIRFGPRPALRLALIFGGTAAIVISPWVVRNQLLYGPAIVIENQGAYNFWIGNDPRPPIRIFREWYSLGDPVLRSRVAVAMGAQAIADEPRRFAANSVRRAINLWGFEYFVIRNLTQNGYGEVEKRTILFFFWVLQIGYMIAFLTAAIGLPTSLRNPQFRVLLGYAVLFTLVTAAMVTTTRFRVPFHFAMAIASGVGLSHLLERRIGRRELVALGIAVLILLSSANRPLFRKIGSGDFERVNELRRYSWAFFRY
ncbi:MAG: glycosyltransferase family 39 protein [Myxococcota bacterium]